MCLFIKGFEELHEIATQHYLRKEKEEFYVLFRKILLLQENTLHKHGEVEEILTKECQYKSSYQGKYCNPKHIYGPWYVGSTINSYTKHLFVFSLFDEKKITMKELDFKV